MCFYIVYFHSLSGHLRVSMEAHMVRLGAILPLFARGVQLSLAISVQAVRNRDHG